MFENTPNQPTKFRTKNWVEINDDSHGTSNTNSEIKFKTSTLKSSLCDYSDTYILVKGIITVERAVTPISAPADNGHKKVVFKNCAPFTESISEINNMQIDNTKYIDVIMLMYNSIEYSDNYSKTSGSVWKYYRDETALDDDGATANFHCADNSASFRCKQEITGKKAANGRKDH